jgi:hypothetical protein
MRLPPRPVALAAVAAGAVGLGLGGALALGQNGGGPGSSGTGTIGPGATVTATAPTPTIPGPAPSPGPPTGPPTGTPGEQTHPGVVPRRGTPRTRFAVRLTLATTPGHSGVLATDYRLQLRVPARRSVSRCSPPAPANIGAGIAHQVVRIPLVTPAGGWCTGRYTLTVFLQRRPYCPRPPPGRPPTPCPLFAERDLAVGTAHFVVAPRP